METSWSESLPGSRWIRSAVKWSSTKSPGTYRHPLPQLKPISGHPAGFLPPQKASRIWPISWRTCRAVSPKRNRTRTTIRTHLATPQRSVTFTSSLTIIYKTSLDFLVVDYYYFIFFSFFNAMTGSRETFTKLRYFLLWCILLYSSCGQPCKALLLIHIYVYIEKIYVIYEL